MNFKILSSVILLALSAFAWAAAPTGGTIAGINCPGYGFYTRGPVCPPPDAGQLAFSDLISGPDTGLGDGNGSGVVVTVWGYNLGSSQGANTIEYCDSLGACRAGHVYYWKNADGVLPSGPANLYESHGMQEIAFSIPDSAAGAGFIKVTIGGTSSTLPFTVRTGNIYHVKTTGNDTTGNGSWAQPWATVGHADSIATAGDTLYIHDVTTTGTDSKERAYYNNRGFQANETNQFAYVSFPNTRAIAQGKVGVTMYLTTGIVSSKLTVLASNCADDTLTGCTESGTAGIQPSDYGRVIGNAISDRPGMCASGMAGAISGGYGKISGAKIFGNYIYDYGCPNSSKLHHTTYFTIRDNDQDRDVLAWQFGWNYLKGNHARMGIHHYDENSGNGDQCGQMITDLKIHDNVVMDQGGPGIYYESLCHWTQATHIYNNVVINSGKQYDVDCASGCSRKATAITIGAGALDGDVHVYNNTFYQWDADDWGSGGGACLAYEGPTGTAHLYFEDNVCYTTSNKPFYVLEDNSLLSKLTASGNSFYTSSATKTLAIVPAWDTEAITADPLVILTNSQISVGVGSPLLNQSSSLLPRDIYGATRSATSAVGAVQ